MGNYFSLFNCLLKKYLYLILVDNLLYLAYRIGYPCLDLIETSIVSRDMLREEVEASKL